jgi:hypothetical protein
MQRTLQPYSVPTDNNRINQKIMDVSGVNTIDPLAQTPMVPMGAQTVGAVSQNEMDASTGKVISDTILNNTPQSTII